MSGAQRVHRHLVETREGAVAVLRVDREEALGALSKSMVGALGEYLRELRGRTDVRVLVLTGTGRGFIAGADIGEYHNVDLAAFDAYQRLSRSVFEELEQLPQPVIAAVNGYALGGGFEVALCCDLIIASERARFGLPEVKLGLLPGGGGTQRLSRAIGTRATKELVMTGRTMKAEEADRLRLLCRVVPADDLLPTALELAQELAARAPLAVREAKRLIDDGIQQSLGAALTTEQSVLSRLFGTADAAEGIDAFIAKREPRFHAR
ncbi:enoyl-CoA hydratase/isomerase family protein [Nonomuraea sp. K274]|uniref:enoyl-CoA hydratase n=1 Tax=Nonomuraea cypriaca TaxID=1187855 RepID=A0A931ADN9_9ACTN|nr:enoyl-CoA hydratase-related protein [Nonomuraea cypriaca]MBF8191052.1 enoyl-CoA hydratase/isomerase family protein [Nonomuraea cypriaca]